MFRTFHIFWGKGAGSPKPHVLRSMHLIFWGGAPVSEIAGIAFRAFDILVVGQAPQRPMYCLSGRTSQDSRGATILEEPASPKKMENAHNAIHRIFGRGRGLQATHKYQMPETQHRGFQRACRHPKDVNCLKRATWDFGEPTRLPNIGNARNA